MALLSFKPSCCLIAAWRPNDLIQRAMACQVQLNGSEGLIGHSREHPPNGIGFVVVGAVNADHAFLLLQLS